MLKDCGDNGVVAASAIAQLANFPIDVAASRAEVAILQDSLCYFDL
jgi:hypothetical protein